MRSWALIAVILFVIPSYAIAGNDSKLSQIVQELHLEELHQAAPEILYKDLDGKTAKLSDEKGRFVLLHLWASWCEPCRKEMPALVAFSRKLNDRPLKLLLISVDAADKKNEAAEILKRAAPSQRFFQIIKDSNSERYYGWGVPMTYLITPDGKIVARAAGCKDWQRVSSSKFKDLLDAAKREM